MGENYKIITNNKNKDTTGTTNIYINNNNKIIIRIENYFTNKQDINILPLIYNSADTKLLHACFLIALKVAYQS